MWNGKGYDDEGNLNLEIIEGKVKEYYNKGKIKFEGEYLNNKKWNGKGYDYNGKCVYEIKEGKGYVKEYDNDKLSFEGEYLNGLENGNVKKY